MPSLKITADISQDESTAVQHEFSSRASWTWDREEYIAPNGKAMLELQLRDEIAFGLRLFSASIKTRDGNSVELSSNVGARKFLSPGRYGQGYDHWDGDPWSPDASQIAIFDFRRHGADGFGGGNLFDVASRKWTRFADGSGVLSHHMWSPNGKHYLFRDMKDWYILNITAGKSRRLSSINQYPRHAYFLSENHLLVIDKSLRILSTESLELLAEENHPELERSSDRYSFYDAKSNRILMGIGTSIRDVVVCDKWYAIEAV